MSGRITFRGAETSRVGAWRLWPRPLVMGRMPVPQVTALSRGETGGPVAERDR